MELYKIRHVICLFDTYKPPKECKFNDVRCQRFNGCNDKAKKILDILKEAKC